MNRNSALLRAAVGAAVAASSVLGLSTPTHAEARTSASALADSGNIVYRVPPASGSNVVNAVVVRAQQAGCQSVKKGQAVDPFTGWLVVASLCSRMPDGTPGAEVIGIVPTSLPAHDRGLTILYNARPELVPPIMIRAQQAGCEFGRSGQATGSLTGQLVIVSLCPQMPVGTPGAFTVGGVKP